MKTCIKCNQTKPLSEFHRRPDSLDGRRNDCCVCSRARIKRCNDARREEIRVNNRKHSIKYNKTGKRKESCRIYRASNPEKILAQRLANAAERKGIVVRPDRCPSCNSDAPLHKHHPDYTKPLDIVWACAICHRKLHITEFIGE